MTKWTCGKDREGDGEEKEECKEEQIWACAIFFLRDITICTSHFSRQHATFFGHPANKCTHFCP